MYNLRSKDLGFLILRPFIARAASPLYIYMVPCITLVPVGVSGELTRSIVTKTPFAFTPFGGSCLAFRLMNTLPFRSVVNSPQGRICSFFSSNHIPNLNSPLSVARNFLARPRGRNGSDRLFPFPHVNMCSVRLLELSAAHTGELSPAPVKPSEKDGISTQFSDDPTKILFWWLPLWGGALPSASGKAGGIGL